MILAASNISSFFVKITELVMEVGKLCPAYAQFGDIYPGSIQLQHALCEYYASVIRLCTKVIVVLNRTALSAALSSLVYPFESMFAEHIAQLQFDVKMVGLQCQYAAAHAAVQEQSLAGKERKANTTFRSLISKERDDASEWRLQQAQRKKLQLKDQIRHQLSSLNSMKAYRRVFQQRVPQTAEWFVTDAHQLAREGFNGGFGSYEQNDLRC